MVRRLAGKVALVTGGGKGIGLGITQRFLEEGARVAVVQRTPLEDRTVREQAFFVQADLSRSDDINRAVDTVFKQFAGLDSWSTMPGSCSRRRSRRCPRQTGTR